MAPGNACTRATHSAGTAGSSETGRTTCGESSTEGCKGGKAPSCEAAGMAEPTGPGEICPTAMGIARSRTPHLGQTWLPALRKRPHAGFAHRTEGMEKVAHGLIDDGVRVRSRDVPHEAALGFKRAPMAPRAPDDATRQRRWPRGGGRKVRRRSIRAGRQRRQKSTRPKSGCGGGNCGARKAFIGGRR